MRYSRRRFVQLTGGIGLGLSGLRARAAAGEPPTTQQLERAAQQPILDLDGLDAPLTIESLELLKKDGEHFIHVRARGGAEGISVTNSRVEYLYPILKEIVFPFFQGKDALRLESDLLFDFYRAGSHYKLQGIGLWCPLAWTEFAILDLIARSAGKSMREILGGAVHTEIPFYIASGRRDSTAEEEVEYLQNLLERSGARAVKFRLGGRMKSDDLIPGRSEKLIALSRKVLGDDIDIHGDANSSYSAEEAIRIGRMLEEIQAVYFEEPCPFDHLQETGEVTAALDIPVALGEQEFSERRFLWVIRDRLADIVQPDLQYYGGMLRSLRVSKMAALAGMPTTVHISGGFGFVYMLHFAAVVPDMGKYQEYKLGLDRYNSWFEEPILVRDGKMGLPKGPGVGIVDIQALLRGAQKVV